MAASLEEKILLILKKSKHPISTREVALQTKKSWHTVLTRLLRLQLAGRVAGFKAGNMHLWVAEKKPIKNK